MAENGNGYNGRYTAQQFIDAMPGTGGIVSALAEKLRCEWHTARAGIDRWPTVKRAWLNERAKISDLAERNVLQAIKDKDLPTSKWWLVLMREEFQPKQKVDVTSGGERIESKPDVETVAAALAILDQKRGCDCREGGGD